MVVGHSTITCLPSWQHLNAARSATSVLPKPTSPQSRRSIGFGDSMSALMSSIAARWSGVSSYGKLASMSACAGVSGANACPCTVERRVYRSTRSNASFLAERRAFPVARDQSAVFRRVRRGLDPSGPT